MKREEFEAKREEYEDKRSAALEAFERAYDAEQAAGMSYADSDKWHSMSIIAECGVSYRHKREVVIAHLNGWIEVFDCQLP